MRTRVTQDDTVVQASLRKSNPEMFRSMLRDIKGVRKKASRFQAHWACSSSSAEILVSYWEGYERACENGWVLISVELDSKSERAEAKELVNRIGDHFAKLAKQQSQAAELEDAIEILLAPIREAMGGRGPKGRG